MVGLQQPTEGYSISTGAQLAIGMSMLALLASILLVIRALFPAAYPVVGDRRVGELIDDEETGSASVRVEVSHELRRLLKESRAVNDRLATRLKWAILAEALGIQLLALSALLLVSR